MHSSITDWHVKLVQDLIEEDKDGLLRKLAKSAMEKKKDTHDLDLERDLIGIIIKFLIAPLTPVYGVGEKCFSQSIAYFRYLTINPSLFAYKSKNSIMMAHL